MMRNSQIDFKSILNQSYTLEISGLGNLPNRLSWVNFYYISAVLYDNPLVKYSIH